MRFELNSLPTLNTSFRSAHTGTEQPLESQARLVVEVEGRHRLEAEAADAAAWESAGEAGEDRGSIHRVCTRRRRGVNAPV